MLNIRAFIEDMHEAEMPVMLLVGMRPNGRWFARAMDPESPHGILDRRGEMFLDADRGTMEDAIAALDILCGAESSD